MGVELEGRMYTGGSTGDAKSSRSFGITENNERRFSGETPRNLELKLNSGLVENAENEEVRKYFAEKGLVVNSPEDLINATIAECLLENEHFVEGYTPPNDEFIDVNPDIVLSFSDEKCEEPIHFAIKFIEGLKGVDQDLEIKDESEIEDCNGNKLTMFRIVAGDLWQETAILYAKTIRGIVKEELKKRKPSTIRENIREKEDPGISIVAKNISKKLLH
ncbi:hypothetical protein ACFL24_00675 [Patescibacteria group bacterium]